MVRIQKKFDYLILFNLTNEKIVFCSFHDSGTSISPVSNEVCTEIAPDLEIVITSVFSVLKYASSNVIAGAGKQVG